MSGVVCSDIFKCNLNVLGHKMIDLHYNNHYTVIMTASNV